jgi:nucleoside-diphosphate-sugar epimerase
MRIVVTGAGGFIGRNLVSKLLEPATSDRGFPSFTSLTLVDLELSAARDARVRNIEGSITDARVRARALEGGLDCLFHLASVPGGAAEMKSALGQAVNLDATLALFEEVSSHAAPPIVVFSSSTAALGPTMRAEVDDDTPQRPANSYGSHKFMAEIALSDLSRRGLIDGRAPRLSGIVARPPGASGFATAFMSDIFRAQSRGEAFECPTPEHAVLWFQSVSRCVENLLHAAQLGREQLPAWRAWTLPATVVSMAELVSALERATGLPSRVHFQGSRNISLPRLRTPLAERLGFRADAGVDELANTVLTQLRAEAAQPE